MATAGLRNARRVRAQRIIAMAARISIRLACGLVGIAVVTVTGTIAHTSLTFVTLVIPQAHRAVISGSGWRGIVSPGATILGLWKPSTITWSRFV
jgi:hypothetical protein